jgi:hypothetical protein
LTINLECTAETKEPHPALPPPIPFRIAAFDLYGPALRASIHSLDRALTLTTVLRLH